mmetsp:Transcript_18828/g.56889  ORF Transcript_18828/g.56889 Transcript_18828/m.56889 type:complete len:341 (+) Transcript_18828:294-1316(+)
MLISFSGNTCRMPAPAPGPIFRQRRQEVAFVVAKWSAWSSPSKPQLQQPLPSRAISCTAAAAPAPAVVSTNDGESVDLSSRLELQNIREALIRQEDTIIFSIIERAQFAANQAVYQADAVPVPEYSANGQRYSLLEYILRQTEQLHGRIRRFTSPDEHAFYPDDVPNLVLPPLKYPEVLAPYAKDININSDIMSMYVNHLLPGITRDDDDGNYGSCACDDVLCLQALSKRIHYGKFVAEAKFQSQRACYVPLIERQDAEGIMDALTDRAVELKVVDRVRWKAQTYGQDAEDLANAEGGEGQSGRRFKVSPDTIAMLYDKWVMPMTKQVQVQYLLRRLESE